MPTYAGPMQLTDPNRVQLDWVAYFKLFVQKHGEPEEIDPVDTPEGLTLYSKLLFPDGWRYSNFDYQGPEYPPPVDELKLSLLLDTYWRQRRARLATELRSLEDHIEGISSWAETRDLPLQQRVVYATRNDDGVEVVVTDVGDMDLAGLYSRVADLQYLVDECDRMIREL